MTARPLTWAQQIVWAGQNLLPSGAHQNQAFCCDLYGPLDAHAMTRAYAALCRDVDALRLTFNDGPDGPRQSAQGDAAPLEHLTFPDRQAAQAWMEERALVPFDLTMRATAAFLLTVGPDHHVVFILQHHLVTDGWSAGLLLSGLGARYSDPDTGAAPAFLALSAGLETARPGAAFDASAQLPPMPLYGRVARQGSTRKVSVPLALGADRQAALLALADQGAFRAFTPLMGLQNILCSVVAAWLSRVCGQEDVAFALPQHNRATAIQRDTIGLFMEMLPLAVRTGPDDSFHSLHARVSQATRALLTEGGPGRTRADLLRHRNVVLNIFSGQSARFRGLRAQARIVPVASADPGLDLNIEFADMNGDGTFDARMVFDKGRFDGPARDRALAHFLTLMDAFLADPGARISQVPLLTAQERASLARFNRRADAPQPAGTIVDAFVQNAGDAPAVSVSGAAQSLSHRALDLASNRMARALSDRGAGPGDLIAVHLPRSIDAIVAILAIHKIGAGYVPIEKSLPAERRDFILRDTAAKIVISDTLPGALHPDAATSCSVDDFASRAQADGVAYVIYTSGSTGQPKGVVVGHAELMGYCASCLEAFGIGRGKRYAFFSAFGFDLVMNSIFMPLMSGGEIVVYPEPSEGADLAILDVIAADEVDFVKPTPSHLRLAVLGADSPLRRIGWMPHSGEAFPARLAQQALAVFGPGLRIFNEYGPTEAVVGAMCHRFNPADADGQSLVPLGLPLPGMRLCVVNAALCPQPADLPGEIAIGGRLARGYLNREALTAEKFVQDPEFPRERLYLTGDLGVFTAQGDLRYLGRLDDQIKLNGVRLELGEVEQAIAAVPGVNAAVVALQQTPAGTAALVAYLQGKAEPQAVADAARGVLPASARLAAIVEMDALPTSSNGKIDRKRLPLPGPDQWLARSGSRSAQTPDEIALAAVFQKVLGMAEVGMEDDFYALGGDSLAAVRITATARPLGYGFSAVDIFRLRTIGALAAQFRPAEPVAARPRRQFSRLSAGMKAQLEQALRQPE